MTVAIQQLNNYSLSNDSEKLKLLKDTFCKGATDQELMLFVHACERTKLDPFMRQIHAVKRWDNTLKREAMTIQTGIDGYRLIAERTGCYSPGREPSYSYDANGNIESGTAYVKKMSKDGSWHEVAATAFYDEYVQRTKDNQPVSMWRKMPRNQLAKCAEALALRKAFPAELSGIYTREEMEQSESISTEALIGQSEVIEPKLVLEKISEKEATELNNLLASCDDTYTANVESYYQKQFGISCWRDLPKEQHIKLLNNINKKLQMQAA